MGWWPQAKILKSFFAYYVAGRFYIIFSSNPSFASDSSLEIEKYILERNLGTRDFRFLVIHASIARVIGVRRERYTARGFDTLISDVARQKCGPKYDHEEKEQTGEHFERHVVNALESFLALHVGVVYVPVLRTCVNCSAAGRLDDTLERIECHRNDRTRGRRRRVFGRWCPGRRVLFPKER